MGSLRDLGRKRGCCPRSWPCLANLASGKRASGRVDFLREQTMGCHVPQWLDVCLEYKLGQTGAAGPSWWHKGALGTRRRTALSTHSVRHSLLRHPLGPSSSVPPFLSSVLELPRASLFSCPIPNIHIYSAVEDRDGSKVRVHRMPARRTVCF